MTVDQLALPEVEQNLAMFVRKLFLVEQPKRFDLQTGFLTTFPNGGLGCTFRKELLTAGELGETSQHGPFRPNAHNITIFVFNETDADDLQGILEVKGLRNIWV
nr:hypothetical protein [Rubinisphaera italica]